MRVALMQGRLMQNFVHNLKSYFVLICLVSLVAQAKTIEEMEAEAIRQKQVEDQATAEAAKKETEKEAEKINITLPEPPKSVPAPTYSLTIQTEPDNATVSIRNIQPKYHDGMRLVPGKYRVRVSAKDYQTQEKWIELGKANKVVNISLKRLPLPPKLVVEIPVVPTPTPVNSQGHSSVATSQNTIEGIYIDHGNGTVTDTKAKLMWKKCSEGQNGNNCTGKTSNYMWDDALSAFGKGITFASYNDWRLPTVEELHKLVYCSNGTTQEVARDNTCGQDGEYFRPTIDKMIFPNTAWRYWSSTEKDAAIAGGVNFSIGESGWYPRSGKYSIRLVRPLP